MKILFLLCIAFVVNQPAYGGGIDKYLPMPNTSWTIPTDTTKYGEDDLDEEEGSEVKPRPIPRDVARERGEAINVLDYQMEGRYLPGHETFAMDTTRFFLPRWIYNTYVQGGVGVETIYPPTDDYELSPMTKLQLGIGKDFNELHSARLMFHGGWGYHRPKEQTMSKFGLSLEHLYNLSGYFGGYRPRRMVNLSTIIGVGAQYSKMEQEKGMSWEAHFGAQLKFFTGPKTYIALEPYVGLGGDKMDLSGNRNWRKTDLFYGANLNLVYYINNNLTKESLDYLMTKTGSNHGSFSLLEARLSPTRHIWT